MAWWRHMRHISESTGNGLLSDGSKPLPESMLTYHHICSVTLTWDNFTSAHELNCWHVFGDYIYNITFISIMDEWVDTTDIMGDLLLSFSQSISHEICIRVWCALYWRGYRLGLYSLRRHRLISIGIPIINLRWSSDRRRFIMGIPIPVRRRLLSE